MVLALVLCAGGASAEQFPSDKLIAEGYRQLATGRYASAVQTLSAALRSNPSSKLARRYLAHALLRSGQAAGAVAQFEELVKGDHLEASDESGLGDAYMHAGNAAKALAAYKTALRIEPRLETARGGLIRSYLTLGKVDEAIQACRESLGQAKTAESRKYYQCLLQDLMQGRTQPEEEETGSAPDKGAPS